MYYIFSYIDTFSGDEVFVKLNDCPSFPYQVKRLDEVIVSQMQDGYRFTRPRFTKSRKSISLQFDYLIEADKDKIDEMERRIQNVMNFKFYPTFPEVEDFNDDDEFKASNPAFYNMVLTSHISYDLVLKNTISTYWNIQLTLEEV